MQRDTPMSPLAQEVMDLRALVEDLCRYARHRDECPGDDGCQCSYLKIKERVRAVIGPGEA